MNMKKVLFVVPNFSWRKSMENINWHYLPYGICMIAAVIERDFAGYDVHILDANKENLTVEAFRERIREVAPDYVGISILMDFFGETMHVAAKAVKETDPRIIIQAGETVRKLG